MDHTKIYTIDLGSPHRELFVRGLEFFVHSPFGFLGDQFFSMRLMGIQSSCMYYVKIVQSKLHKQNECGG